MCYQPNKFTIYQYGAILIYFSKSSHILILSYVVFMWNHGEKPESFVQYMLHSFLRVENLCFWQSVLTFRLPESLYIDAPSDMNFVYSWYMIRDTNFATKGRFEGSNPGSLKVQRNLSPCNTVNSWADKSPYICSLCFGVWLLFEE